MTGSSTVWSSSACCWACSFARLALRPSAAEPREDWGNRAEAPTGGSSGRCGADADPGGLLGVLRFARGLALGGPARTSQTARASCRGDDDNSPGAVVAVSVWDFSRWDRVLGAAPAPGPIDGDGSDSIELAPITNAEQNGQGLEVAVLAP